MTSATPAGMVESVITVTLTATLTTNAVNRKKIPFAGAPPPAVAMVRALEPNLTSAARMSDVSACIPSIVFTSLRLTDLHFVSVTIPIAPLHLG
ncbi:hypothetical protein BV898_16795 [Hypsibius exemplaris]|uniref:Lipoxygenase domain-containing protein n=1 Tax=Hypsibius exemplaris TaxID=2072580 RepID=A0A9X6RLU7_HYPEX|nr:hypothetical protein BV898_16795 [Hypsibius exemplaris]